MNSSEIFKSFFERFYKNESFKPDSKGEIELFEKDFKIKFPLDFREFLKTYGDLYTPKILDLIVDNDLEMNDVQEFWNIEQIRNDKENGWTHQSGIDLIPFALDSMGNIFAFKTDEIKTSKESSNVYFFDHDFGTIDFVSKSFTNWIESFLLLKN